MPHQAYIKGIQRELDRIKKERDDYKMWAIKLNNLLRREGWSQGEIDSAAFPDEEGAG